MFTRRQLLVVIGLVGTSLTGGAIWLYRRGPAPGGNTRGDSLATSVSPVIPDERILSTVVEFLGGLFGHALTAEDRSELLDRLQYAIGIDAEFAAGYATLADHAERLARHEGAASFFAATEAQRQAVVGHVMNVKTDALLPRLLVHVSESARRYYNLRWQTIPTLIMLYRRSGVPWRARGYRRWPGIPGNWTEYLVAGPTYPS